MLGLGEAVGGLVKEALGPLLNLIPDPNARKEAEEKFNSQILGALTGLVKGQLAINQQEAAHPSVFVAGWRPFIGWVCGAGFAWAFLLQPFVSFFVVIFSNVDPAKLPELDTGQLLSLALGMLGLGGLRTYEKQIGTARSVWRKQLTSED